MPAAVEPFPGVAVVAKPLSRQATAKSNEGARPAAVACGATALMTHGGANGSSRLMLDGAGGGGRGRAAFPCAAALDTSGPLVQVLPDDVRSSPLQRYRVRVSRVPAHARAGPRTPQQPGRPCEAKLAGSALVAVPWARVIPLASIPCPRENPKITHAGATQYRSNGRSRRRPF
jgi:hypothetical protein